VYLLSPPPPCHHNTPHITELSPRLCVRLSAAGTDGDTSGPAIFVSLVSACNGAGRLLAGYASDLSVHRLGMPRPLGLVLANVCLTASMGALTLEGMQPLYVACIGGGLSCTHAASYPPPPSNGNRGTSHLRLHPSLLVQGPLLSPSAVRIGGRCLQTGL
jgi:hypothetical protein